MSDELSPEAKAILAAGRDESGPSAEDRNRVRQRIVATLGVGAFGSLGAAGEASAAAAAGGAGAAVAATATSTKLALAVLGVVGVVGAGVLGVRTLEPRPAQPRAVAASGSPLIEEGTPERSETRNGRTAAVPAAAPEPAAESAAVPDPVVEPGPVSVAAELTRPPRPPRQNIVGNVVAPVFTPGRPLEMTRAHSPTLQPELELIGAAQALLGSGDAAGALAHLDRHAEHFAEGVLAQERMAARAIALCRLERRAEGRRELAELARTAPRSPLLARARSECPL